MRIYYHKVLPLPKKQKKKKRKMSRVAIISLPSFSFWLLGYEVKQNRPGSKPGRPSTSGSTTTNPNRTLNSYLPKTLTEIYFSSPLSCSSFCFSNHRKKKTLTKLLILKNELLKYEFSLFLVCVFLFFV